LQLSTGTYWDVQVQHARDLASSCENDVKEKLDNMFNQLIGALLVLPESISRYVPGEVVVSADYESDQNSDKVVLVLGKCKGLTPEHMTSPYYTFSEVCHDTNQKYRCMLEKLPLSVYRIAPCAKETHPKYEQAWEEVEKLEEQCAGVSVECTKAVSEAMRVGRLLDGKIKKLEGELHKASEGKDKPKNGQGGTHY